MLILLVKNLAEPFTPELESETISQKNSGKNNERVYKKQRNRFVSLKSKCIYNYFSGS